MRRTTGAVIGSGSSRCRRRPSPALLGFGCAPASGESVAERRAAALEPSLDHDLGLHRGPNTGLDAVAFRLARATVERHDDVVRVAVGVDYATDLGHPAHTVMPRIGTVSPNCARATTR